MKLRATLPISIFISPNLPLDDEGNLVEPASGGPAGVEVDHGAIAPPGYGEHVLDQLYDEMDVTGFQTPAIQSGVSSPFYIQSRAGSSENLASMINGAVVSPAALSSRLANVSLDPTQRNATFSSLTHAAAPRSEPNSTALTRSNSGEDSAGPSGRHSPEHIHIDESEFAELNKVPSYSTAVRSPVVARTPAETYRLPDYQTALSAPRTPPATDAHPEMTGILTESQAGSTERPTRQRPSRQVSEDAAGERRIHVIQARGQVA